MKQERIEAFANEIKEKNRYNKLTQTISFYVMVLGWITYCIVNDYAAVWAGQSLIPTGLVLLYVVNLWMYCMNFVNGYTKVEGKGGKSVQDIWECVNPMPFAFGDYMSLIQKKFTRVLLGVGVLHTVSAVIGMFVSARVNVETDRMEYIWLLPDKAGRLFAFCVIISVLFFVAMYSFFYIQKYRVMRFVSSVDKKPDGKKRNNRFLAYMQIILLVLGVGITLVVLFVGLFQYDTDPFLTICFMVLLLALLPLRYWYITLLVIVLAVILIVRGAKKRKQLKERPELVKTSRSRIIGKHVIGLGVLQVGILLVVPFIYNIYAEENVAGYSTTDWLEYGYFDGHYEGEDYDRYTGLFVFPERLSPNAENVEYYYAARPGFLDSSYDIYLNATYPQEEYEAEKERLAKISCTIEINAKGDTMTNDILYMEDMCQYPAYVTICDYNGIYEYALLDEENCRIVYVFTQYSEREQIPEEFWLVKDDTRAESVWYDGEDDFNLYYGVDENGDFPYFEDK